MLSGKLLSFKSFDNQIHEDFLKFEGSYIFTENELIIKEAQMIRVFNYLIDLFQEEQSPRNHSLDLKFELMKAYQGCLYLINPNTSIVATLGRYSLQMVLETTGISSFGIDITRQVFRNSHYCLNYQSIIGLGRSLGSQIFQEVGFGLSGFDNGVPLYENQFISKLNHLNYTKQELAFLQSQMEGLKFIDCQGDSVLVAGSEVKVIYIREMKISNVIKDLKNEGDPKFCFRLGNNQVVYRDENTIYCVQINQQSCQIISEFSSNLIMTLGNTQLKISDNEIMFIDKYVIKVAKISEGQVLNTVTIEGIQGRTLLSYWKSNLRYKTSKLNNYKDQMVCLDDKYQVISACEAKFNDLYFYSINSEYYLKCDHRYNVYLLDKDNNVLTQIQTEILQYSSLIYDRTKSEDIYFIKDDLWYKFNILKEDSVPILTKKDIFCKIEIDSESLAYFENFQKIQQHQQLSSIKIRSSFNSILDFEKDRAGMNKNLNEDIIRYIEKNSLSEILSYKTYYRRYFLKDAIGSKDIMEALLKKLDVANSNEIPFLFPYSEQSACLFDNCEAWIIDRFLKLMLSTDSRGILYNQIIYKNIDRLIEHGIDLKSYFRSPLFIHKILDFPEYHNDENEHLVGANFYSLTQLVNNYDKVFSKVNLSLENKQANEKAKDGEVQLVPVKEKQKEVEIEYFAIRVGIVEGQDHLQLAKQIQTLGNKDITYFDIESIQLIVRFKWETYARSFYMLQFIILIFFIVALLFDFLFCQSLSMTQMHCTNCKYASQAVCLTIILQILSHEIRQILKSRQIIDQFSDFWNIFDLLLIMTYLAYLPISYLQTIVLATKTIQCLIVLFTFIKVTFFLRIFQQFSFLVQMLISVFKDLRFFLAFFSFFILTFAVFIAIVVDGDFTHIDPYSDTKGFTFILIAIRQSIGDSDLTSLLNTKGNQPLAWTLWFMIALVGNVTFMNFIIAVVNDSYANCMSNMTAQQHQVKVDMIIERESIMSESDLANTEWFPNYIVLRRMANNSTESGEWQEFVSEIKLHSEKSFANLQSSQEKSISDLKQEIIVIKTEQKEENMKMQASLDEIKLLLSLKARA